MWNTPEKTVNISFEKYTAENEKKLRKLKGNLKKSIKFITPDIFIDSSSIILDIGANIGKFTSIFNQYGCTIYAFEPTKNTFNILKNRFNGIENVNCINQACYTKDTQMNLYHHELSSFNDIYWSDGNSLLETKSNISKNDYEIVNCIDLSNFIFEITKKINKNIDLVKMDIEGAEIELINHLIDTSAIEKINYLICETHEKKNKHLIQNTSDLKKRVESEKLNNKIYFNWI